VPAQLVTSAVGLLRRRASTVVATRAIRP